MERTASLDRRSAKPAILLPLPDEERSGAGRLPAPLISLIGREEEIAAACAIVRQADVRLLTFTGPGGVGKTQLALAVGRELRGDFAEGVVFVPLAPLSDSTLVAPTIAQALGIRTYGADPVIDSIRAAIGERELFLVLDNFEHVTEAAPLLVDLLTSCSRLQILVTRRALLQITGERAVEVLPLGLPNPSHPQSAEELTHYDAVRLFVSRAHEVKPSFALTDRNDGTVAELCVRLDGLPLALELAAARMRVLTPSSLLEQLTDHLHILTSGHRDAPERLRTLRHAIGWSYDLLTSEEQRLFRRLSVFVGGFTLDAAKIVGAASAVLEYLSSLIDKSLVQQSEQPHGEPRFSLLETIREYGLEQLGGSGEVEDLRASHAAYFLAFAEQIDQIRLTEVSGTTGDRLEVELPNIRAVFAWAENHNTELMLRLALALWWFWEDRGSLEEAGTWLERTIEATTGVPSSLYGLRAQLLAVAVLGATWQGNYDRAAVLAEEASSLAAETGDAKASAMVALSLGHLAIWREDWGCAETYLTDALAQWRDLTPSKGLISTLYRLGLLAALQGKQKEAESWFAEDLAVAQAQGWTVPTAFALEALGSCALDQGDRRRAASYFAEALTLARDGSALGAVANCFQNLGAIAAATGKPEQGVHLYGACEALRVRRGFNAQPTAEYLHLEQAIAPARKALSNEAFAAAWTEGREMPLDQAIAVAFDVANQFDSEHSPAQALPAGLTSREQEVLRLLVEGLSDKEIAEALGTSPRTASKHVETIRGKLDVPSRTAAAIYATRHGLI
ncbi:MAG: ATP-binding protein [Thermomicrobiales bacterium]